MPDAADVARLALPELARGNTVDAVAVQPSYIRDDVGWQKTPGR
jgi:tRNA threonylcarbamoyladenosine biosynthesis protein TsaB